MSKKIAVIGGGIVGLATAYKILQRMTNVSVVVFEKENSFGQHQSGRNSGVLHCGLYYQPGSLKAKLAVTGIQEMTDFCIQNNIPHDLCGKIVVANDEQEIKQLEDLASRGAKNGLEGLRYLNNSEIKEREPNVRARKALLVPQEGIVDYKAVMKTMADKILESGGEIITGVKIEQAENRQNEVILKSNNQEWIFDLVFNCAGLHSDRNFEKLTKKKRPFRIVPFRGEYLKLKPEYSDLVNHLIYPVPDPEYPFLGVHFTRLISGEREVGPNAVFAFKREGYTNSDISILDTFDSLSYRGFFNFISKNFAFSMNEFGSSIFTSLFLKKAKKLVPDIEAGMFNKGTAGVRAQAMAQNGKLMMDFNIVREGNQIHILNAPSPGATASLAIADYILDEYLG
ncbi:MAG: L-2-hydroxyglutarate oxidase [Chitinophagia bacterium]|jgi:L-2-hydroxyglutarate oxidase